MSRLYGPVHRSLQDRFPPGAPAISDLVDLTVAPFGSLAVSLFLPVRSITTLKE